LIRDNPGHVRQKRSEQRTAEVTQGPRFPGLPPRSPAARPLPLAPCSSRCRRLVTPFIHNQTDASLHPQPNRCFPSSTTKQMLPFIRNQTDASLHPQPNRCFPSSTSRCFPSSTSRCFPSSTSRCFPSSTSRCFPSSTSRCFRASAVPCATADLPSVPACPSSSHQLAHVCP
jgi:hypothetical protein